MYYKESILNGVLYYQHTVNGAWYSVSNETLTQRLNEAENNLRRTGRELESVNEENSQLLDENQELQEENKRLTEELSAYKVQMEAIAQKVDLLHAVALNAFGPVQG